MLDLVKLEQFYGSPYVIRSPPFADMRFKAETGRLSLAVDGREYLYRLRSLIPGQVKCLEHPKFKKGSRPPLDRCDAAVARDAQLRNPINVRSTSAMSPL